jgi:hypothetical protein
MSNVTDAGLRRYLEVFHAEYRASVERYLPEDFRSQLLRYSLRESQIRGYVSTNFGAAYEYAEGEPGINITRGSQRVEELLVQAPPSLRKIGPMLAIGGPDTAVVGLTLEGGFPFHLVSEAASLRLVAVAATAGTWRRDFRLAEVFGSRTAEAWSEATAVRRAKDEVIQALFDVQQSKASDVDLATYLSGFKERTVLVLGDFNHGRDRLDVIRAGLRKAGYRPVLLDEIPEEPNYDLRQKFLAVAAVVRFLVFDDTTPSGHIAELMMAEQLQAVRLILREGERQSSFMTRATDLTSRVVRELTFDEASVDAVIAEGSAWAEATLVDLQAGRSDVYPWRSAG